MILQKSFIETFLIIISVGNGCVALKFFVETLILFSGFSDE